ncbi:MAG: GAF domain-containing protein [Phycisphaera sp.]|nr:GAF domain-containing protein [Phycisphaera sp.]
MDRREQEMAILERISEILGSSLEIEDLFGQVMALLTSELGVSRAALVLKDEFIGRLRIVAAMGLSDEEKERGQYEVGEGVTGQVVQTGRARIVADIANEPDFLNRTGMGGGKGSGQMSFICVPIKIADRPVGAISASKPFVDDATLATDARLLRIITGNIAQAQHVHQLVKREKDQWLEETQRLRENLRTKYRFENIIGTSPAMMDVLATVGQVSASRATVLLLGETGTGKELIAKAIHYNSPRRDKPFVRVNCGALSETLLESELFGHVKGSFTGAVRDKVGRFEAADGGTIFLDEIGTLDPQLQVKLLRVLQEREFERVGDHRTIKCDVRVIAATNLDLAEEVRKQNFREDLYYRLNVVTIYLPPLRGRREDIPQLIDHFLDKYNAENTGTLHKISREMMNTLLRYPWPGNVRELENAIERAVVLSNSDEFTEDLLPIQIRMFAQQGRDKQQAETIESLARRLSEQAVEEYAMREGEVWELVVGEVEKQLITRALERNGGVKTRSADFLGINRNTLNKKVKEMEIVADD